MRTQVIPVASVDLSVILIDSVVSVRVILVVSVSLCERDSRCLVHLFVCLVFASMFYVCAQL